MARVAAGDRAAFRAVVAAHREAAWRVVRARVSDDARAEDVLQEAFLGVWRGAAGYRGDASLRSWIAGLARRQAARSWRRRAGEPVAHAPLDGLGAAAGWGHHDPERAVAALEDRDALWRALERLSDDDRQVIELRDLLGHTGPEAAEVLGIDVGALKSRLHRARLRLMAALREEGRDGQD